MKPIPRFGFGVLGSVKSGLYSEYSESDWSKNDVKIVKVTYLDLKIVSALVKLRPDFGYPEQGS